MVYAFDWLDDEFDFIDRLTARRARFAQAKKTATPDLARRAVDLTRHWPNLQPGVIQSFLLAGVTATSPVAVLAATRAAQADNRDNAGTKTGQPVKASWLARATSRPQRQDPADLAGDPFGLGLAGRAASAAAGGISRAWDASGLDNVVEPAVRTAFVGMEGIYHEAVARPIQAAAAADNIYNLGSPGRYGLIDAYRAQPASTMTHALHALANGQPVDVGSGFFGDPEAKTTAKYHRQVQQNQLQGGVHSTPARAIFEDLGINAVVEPGTRPYQLLSGLVDLGLGVFADPAGAVLGGVSKAKKAERTFGASLEQAGGIAGWARKTVDPQTAANDWLDTNRIAGKAVDYLTDTDDFTTIWNALGRRNVPRQAVRDIADATDPGAVRAILRDNLTTHMRVKPTARGTNRQMGRTVGALFDLQSSVAKTGGRFDRPTSARDIGELFGVGAAVRHGLGGQRAFAMMPKTSLDMTDLGAAQETLYRSLQTAKLPDDVARGFMDRFSRITPDDLDARAKAVEVARDFHAEVGGRLTSKGVAQDLARRATRMTDEYDEDVRIYFQMYGDDVLFEGAKKRTFTTDSGEVIGARASAQLLTEQSKTVPLFDDLTEFRRVTGIAEQIRAAKGKSLWNSTVADVDVVRMTANGWSTLMGRWGQAQLARLAWPVRVIMEEQARMAADGLDSAYRHPLRYLQWALAHDPESAVGKGVKQIAEKVGVEGVNPVDVMGDASNLAVQRHMAMNKAASKDWAGITGRKGGGVSGDYVKWYKNDPRKKKMYSRAWAGELSQLWSDPVASRLAGGLREGDTVGKGAAASGNAIADVHRWLYKGNGRRHLEQLASDEGKRHLLEDPDALMRYLDGGIDPDDGAELKGVWQRIQYQTGGNPELIDALGSGRLDGHDLRGLAYDRRQVYKALDDRVDSAPEAVKAMRGLDDPGYKANLDRATDRMFEHLFSMPDNVLSRLPAYDQNYWRRMTELTSVMSDDVARDALTGAKNANIPRNLRRQLEARIGKGDGSITSLEAADLLAKDHALSETKKLLYDVAERSNFAEGTRFVTAFAEAWKEIASTWGRLIQESPQIARRGQQIIESARESNPADLLPESVGGDGDPSTGDGFFFRDPTTDREKFAYPGLGVLAHKLIGLPGDPTDMEQTASAQGINLFAASVLPGFGPVAQMAVSELIPDKPQWDGIREALMPYGSEDTTGVGSFTESLLPAWAKKMQSAWFGDRDELSDRTWASTVGDVAEYLAANDESYYDDNGMLDQTRLEADAKEYGRDLMMLRGIAQFSLPTGPAATFSIKDEGGELWVTSVLGDELSRLQYGDPETGEAGLGRSEGMQAFLDRFGADALLATEGSSAEIRKRALSKPGAKWERDHPQLVDKYPDVIGFFAPESPDDFAIDAWSGAHRRGDIVALTQQQRIAAHNTTVGHVILNRAVTEIEDTGLTVDSGPGAAYMASRRAFLDDTYPGWNERVGVGGKLSTAARLTQIEQAVADPAIRRTAAGSAAKKYLDARAEVNASVGQFSPTAKSFADAKATAPLRAFLRQYGARLARETPEFAPMWEQVMMAEGRMRPDREYDAPTEETIAGAQ